MADECLIWGTPEKHRIDPKDPNTLYDSPRAGGKYCMSHMAHAMISSWTDQEKVKLTSWLVEQRRLGYEWPEVDLPDLDDILSHPESSVQARMDNLLRYFEQKNKLVGDVVQICVDGRVMKMFLETSMERFLDASYEILAWTESCKMTEVVTLLEECQRLEWIECRELEKKIEGVAYAFREVMLRAPGYRRLEELEKTNVQSEQAFVAMWFDNTMNDAFKEGIKKGIELAGYRAVRIDGVEHNNKIDDEIIAEIRRSRFLVADFTQEEGNARGGVYYEAGFAHGLNIPVIFTCRGDAIEYVHFDTRQYNHIRWEDKKFNDLAEKLAERISTTVGNGPLKGVNQKRH